MLKRFVQIFGGDPTKKTLDKYIPLVDQVNALEAAYEKLSDDALHAKTAIFRQQLAQALRGIDNEENRRSAEQTALDVILPEAFATVREASKRNLGLRPFDVQIIGGAVLHQGKIAEMRTGEGKTLVATLPIYLNALTGRGVHLITVNDYLARMHARWMAQVYNALDLSVGVLQMAARTENGKKAFVVDLKRSSPQEDQHLLSMEPRSKAYACDITYGTNSEFGFDYLRDNMAFRWEDRVQRGHYYAIVDEVDNVLIDEARTPLIISGPAQDESEAYNRMAVIVRQLRSEDYDVNEKDRSIALTEMGEAHVEELLGVPLRDPDRPEDLTPDQERTFSYLEQALRAQHLFHRNKDYLVQNRQVIIVDEFTGRMMPGRRWSDGLHQAVEAKEGVRVQPENVTHATITIQNYFRMYQKLAGMSGTALTEAEEFDKIYKLGVMSIPTNLDYQAARGAGGLLLADGQDEKGYKYQFYTGKNDAQRKPLFWKRKDYPDVVYRTLEIKLRALTTEILTSYASGRPVLVGTTSVDLSERISARLKMEPVRRLVQTLLLRQAWFTYNKREEDGRQVPELLFLNGALGELDLNAMRKMAREMDLPFNPEDPINLDRLVELLELEEGDRPRLLAALQGGIAHQVLNARKHTEESQIIARAGEYGAVTIATNMAGRGVDIKLGGELDETILSNVNRILRRAGHEDPYDMSMEARRSALLSMQPEEYGLFEDDIRHFLQYMDAMERVRQLGGLHVIGSERHEARRIDNQLRGRSARQGDPGSSRFYLSMEDELMRLFGGAQADSLMQRMKVDDSLPLEVGLVGRIVEQSQSRVEGQNFDVRKHLLEYDDVLNTQRLKIYAQRDRIFQKEDLSEDVTELLRAELNQRIPTALEDDEGPWKLLSWLEQIQPTLALSAGMLPSYTLRLVMDYILDGQPAVSPERAQEQMLKLAEESMTAEHEHILRLTKEAIDKTEEALEKHIAERLEEVDLWFEGLEGADETDTRSVRQLSDELNQTARLPLRLPPEMLRSLREDPEPAHQLVKETIERQVTQKSIAQLVMIIERRLGEELGTNPAELAEMAFDDIYDQLLQKLVSASEKRRERHLGQIQNSLEGRLRRKDERQWRQDEVQIQELDQDDLIDLYREISQFRRSVISKKTHRVGYTTGLRFQPLYFAARLLEKQSSEAITAAVLQHLEDAQTALQMEWGQADWNRIANRAPAQLDAATQRSLRSVLGEAGLEKTWGQPLGELNPSDQKLVVAELGRKSLTGIYRQLLLSIITNLWVDYLTQMEALRISIGLESYAQRDPLVQYKNKAFELFQQLMGNMRLEVVARMFTYTPRDLSAVQSTVSRGRPGESETEPAAVTPALERGEQAPESEAADGGADEESDEAEEAEVKDVPGSPGRSQPTSKKKRRRHRR